MYMSSTYTILPGLRVNIRLDDRIEYDRMIDNAQYPQYQLVMSDK
jgi:hypothetical protein